MQSTQTVHNQGLKKLKTNDDIEVMLWIDFREDPAQSTYPLHGHAWGEFIYAFNGVMDIYIGEKHYITPSPYGIWLPPNIRHSSVNRTAVSHATLYVHESLCQSLPQHVGVLLTSPLVNAILQHLKTHDFVSTSVEHLRLLHVLTDQLSEASIIETYLPHSDHIKLQGILDYLYAHPEDQSALQSLAKQHNMSERTLARYCQKELGMSLHEWRQRLKVTQAMSLLKQNKSVEQIAFDLGYANASAFIHMFKRWMGTTPDQLRKSSQNL